MKKRFLASVLLVVMSVMLVAGCGSKEDNGDSADTATEEETKEETKEAIRVATNPTFAPASYKDDDGNLTGFEPALMEEIGKRCNREIEWVEAEGMDNLFGNLDAGKVDTIAFQISINEERKANYTFSDVYGTNKIYLAVREDFKYDTLEDLHGMKVCVPPTHSLYPILEEYNADLPDDQKIQFVTSEGGSLYDELELGRIDAFPLTEVAYEAAMEKQDYKIRLGGEPLVYEENAYPFAKDADTELINDINEALESMREDGTLSEISMEYYKVDVTQE